MFSKLLELVHADSGDSQQSVANAEWNASASLYHKVPLDVRLMIWGLSERASDLLNARLTCRLVGLKDLHVRSRFWAMWSQANLKGGSWLSYSLNSQPPPSMLRSAVMRLFGGETEQEDEADMAAFCTAIRNHGENGRALRATAVPARANAEGAWIVERRDGKSGMLGRLLRPSCFVPIFGHALETSARRLVYRLMWGSEGAPPLLPVTGVFPGTGGMGGGVSFSVNRRTVNLAPFYSWQDGPLEVNPVLSEVCRSCNGLCFVVDDAVLSREDEGLARVRNMLHTLLSIAPPAVPVLVLSFAAATQATHAHDPREVIRLLGFDPATAKRVLSVRNVPESTDRGVAEGFEWLTEVM